MSKKTFLLTSLVAAAAGVLLARKVQAERAEQDLWTEATDPIDLR